MNSISLLISKKSVNYHYDMELLKNLMLEINLFHFNYKLSSDLTNQINKSRSTYSNKIY